MALVSDLLLEAGFQHAFFTRIGGVSTGPYASLSFSWAAGDASDAVEENLRRAERFLDVEAGHLLFPSQVHGTKTLRLAGEPRFSDVLRTEADAILADPLGLSGAFAVGVRSADCVPVLVADRERGSVLAIHAGWRGVADRIVPAALRELLAGGSRPEALVAAVGPHISLDAFEVGDDVAASLAAASTLGAAAVQAGAPRPHVDLRAVVTAQLGELGVTAVDQVAGCTLTDGERFFSFRRDGAQSGRHLSAIRLRS